MTIGIYILYFENDDGMYYVGQSHDIEGRHKQHTGPLKNNNHDNCILQEYYNRYLSFPTQYLPEETSLKDLDTREVHWTKVFDSYRGAGFNRNAGGAGGGRGEDSPTCTTPNETTIDIMFDLAYANKTARVISIETGVSEDVISNISLGANHGWLASDYPEVHADMRARVGTRSNMKHEKDRYLQAFLRMVYTEDSLVKISEDSGISLAAITHLSVGSTHKYLANSHPLEHAKLLAKVGTRRQNMDRVYQYPNILDPKGISYGVTNACSFAREHALNENCLNNVLRGKRKSHKGWTLAPQSSLENTDLK